jgi:pimeloyl-ACP methyl ester carboxylesterase
MLSVSPVARARPVDLAPYSHRVSIHVRSAPRAFHLVSKWSSDRITLLKATSDPFKPSVTVVAETPSVQTADAEPMLKTRKWVWNGHDIAYRTAGCGPPIILIHGFGASSYQYRFNIPELAKTHKVYAIDLLGFGESAKPNLPGGYSMEVWRDQIVAFMDEFVEGKPAVLVGNSIGSLASLMVAATSPDRMRGIVLLNTAGAMNNKGITSDWRIRLVLPIIYLIDFLLRIRPIASALFERVRSRENIRGLLTNVYANSESVDDALVESFYQPSCDEGALDVFVSVLTGPPGPKPYDLLPSITCPLLILWGDVDKLTPQDGPIGQYMESLGTTRPNTRFVKLTDVGHCLHDDRPELVHSELIPWLGTLGGTGKEEPTLVA